jgi:hypothetical protein
MCALLTVQGLAQEPAHSNPLRRFWLILRSAKPRSGEFPVTLGNLSPHMHRDIGLDPRPDGHWSDMTAFIDRE